MPKLVPLNAPQLVATMETLMQEAYAPCATPGCAGTGPVQAMVDDRNQIGFCVTCPCGSSTDFHPGFVVPGTPANTDALAAAVSGELLTDAVRAAGIPIPDDPVPPSALLDLREPACWSVTSRPIVEGVECGPAGDWQPFAVTQRGDGAGGRVWYRQPMFDEGVPVLDDEPGSDAERWRPVSTANARLAEQKVRDPGLFS